MIDGKSLPARDITTAAHAIFSAFQSRLVAIAVGRFFPPTTASTLCANFANGLRGYSLLVSGSS
jgi:hypothetical protein